jgi:hypothetical protein
MSHITTSKERYQEFLNFYESPCQSKLKAMVFRSFTGVLYCSLTALRDSLYFERIVDSDSGLASFTPSTCTSLGVRFLMESLYALLAVASLVELVVRIPLATITLVFAAFGNCSGLTKWEWVPDGIVRVLADNIWGVPAAALAVINNVGAIFFNLFNAPILETTLSYPDIFSQQDMLEFATKLCLDMPPPEGDS